MATALSAYSVPARATARPLLLSRWLFAVAGLVFLMIVVGGITRLTESGLSITRWEPFTGAIPPLSHAAWEEQFALYKASPQYRLMNAGMSLGQYQWIFFWEYAHRLLGRLIGLAFALPLAVFALRRFVPAGYGPRLVLLLALGGLQGTVGWWMVMSGLEDGRVNVSHIRLALHLVFAFTLFAALIWTALDLRTEAAPQRVTAPRWRSWLLPFGGLLALQILFGAFTAGLRAGHLYTTWPLIAGGLTPPELGLLAPFTRDLLYNPATVQFVHRTLAILVALFALHIAAKQAKAGAGWRAGALAAAVILQFGLGVLTLIHNVPVPLGVAHQACAALLLAATVALAHWSTRRA